MTIARALALAVVLCVGAACSGGGGADPETGGSSTTGSTVSSTTGSSTTSGPPIPDDAVWILGDPDLTFVRIEPRKQVPFGSGWDPEVPIVEDTRLLLRYSRSDGGAVYVEQGDLVDPETTLTDVVDPGGGGFPPTLTTTLGASRVVISAPEDDLIPLAATLEPVTRAVLDEMVHEVTTGVIAQGVSEPVVDGISFHREVPGADALACLDGHEPEGCAAADRYGPLVMAPIPQGDTYTVVGCIDQPIPIGELTVDGAPVPTQAAPCGQAFSVPAIAPGTLAIAFDDGPGGVGTYTFTLP